MVSEKELKELGVVNWSVPAKDFEKADLLLGNGFSLNLKGHFDYKSLFEEFIESCEPSTRKIFRSLGTNNFELIQESLISTKRVNKLFSIKDNENKIDDAISSLKNGLIKSVRKNHPLASQIDFNHQLHNLSLQLNDFGDIFTLNYDLFLYHIIMQMKKESDKRNEDAPYSDFFWGGELGEPFKQFMGYDEYNRKYVYYLHGALFLFKIPPNTFKLKRGDSEELVSMIGDAINNGHMPLFVSEGSYKEKLKAIERSTYLSFCYETLEGSINKLVIFGSSLSNQDAHIIDAIKYRGNNRELAIAIHIGNKSKGDLEKEIKRLKDRFKSHKIYFFDSETIFKF